MKVVLPVRHVYRVEIRFLSRDGEEVSVVTSKREDLDDGKWAGKGGETGEQKKEETSK